MEDWFDALETAVGGARDACEALGGLGRRKGCDEWLEWILVGGSRRGLPLDLLVCVGRFGLGFKILSWHEPGDRVSSPSILWLEQTEIAGIAVGFYSGMLNCDTMSSLSLVEVVELVAKFSGSSSPLPPRCETSTRLLAVAVSRRGFFSLGLRKMLAVMMPVVGDFSS